MLWLVQWCEEDWRGKTIDIMEDGGLQIFFHQIIFWNIGMGVSACESCWYLRWALVIRVFSEHNLVVSFKS